MAWIHVRHRVEDYSRWKEVYDASAGLKRSYGWKRYRLFMVEGDRSDILVMEEFETAQQARSFMQSDDIRNAMHLAGVIGEPEVWILAGLEEGTA